MTFPTNGSPSQGTEKEINTIIYQFEQTAWSIEKCIAKEATESHFKNLSGNAPRILHIATHGFFLPDIKVDAEALNRGQLLGHSYQKSIALSDQPLMRSGLILAGANHAWQGNAIPFGKEDGILTAYEIAGLDLRNTELVRAFCL